MLEKTIREFIGPGRVPQLALRHTVADAADLMLTLPADGVVVVDGGRPVGIFTERDFLNRVVAVQRPHDTPLGDVMTPGPATLRPDDSIAYAVNRMAMGGFRNVPVVDGDGRLLAVITARDVAAHLHVLFGALEDEGTERPEWGAWQDIGGGD